MPLTANRLVKQVDLPVWEWLRVLPVASGAGLSASCTADQPQFSNFQSGRYIYILLNATNFWRYDTIADSYMQLMSPGITPATGVSLRFAGALGYHGRAISSTSTTLQTGVPYNGSPVGYRIRIVSGTGAGQERLITAVSDPTVHDFGGATAGAATSLTDANKNWGFTGTANNVNTWAGYTVRIVGGTGINQVRRILYSSSTVLTIADPALVSVDPWAVPISPTAGAAGWTAPAAGSVYQIESCIITVDTPWSINPDSSSRYIIQAGGVWMQSIAAQPIGFTVQFYSILEDIWYAKTSLSGMVPITPTDAALERPTENSTLWDTGEATSGTSTSLTDSSKFWATNIWTGYSTFIWTGTGKAQLGQISSNTSNTLTFSNTLATAPDATSQYNIMGYDAGNLSASTGRVVSDSTKNWTVNQWTNYGLRIIAGTGDGQTRQIQQNGNTSIVVRDTWNVQPDSTSVYQILPYSMDQYLQGAANAQTYIYRTGDVDLITHNRVYDEGIICVAAALPCDGTDTTTHVIFDQKPIAISSLAGTTTITATTAITHNLRVGQWVSIRGVTSAAADVYNVTGKVQILSVPTATTFTYTPFAAGTGTYAYSNGVTIGATVYPDASKYHADLATGGSTTSVTFSRATPSNINGWYVYGTNIGAGAQVQSGAGTTTLTLNIAGAGTPSGTITFSKWPQPVTGTFSSGGGAGVFTVTLSAAVPAYCKGWLVTGSGIGVGAILTGGEGTSTINLSLACTGAVTGTITFSHPVNNPLPVSRTYSSGTGNVITLTSNAPDYVRGWWVSGTNIANGTTVTGGEATPTINLSTATSGTPSGTITFYAPSRAPAMIYGTQAVAALAATTGLSAAVAGSQLIAQNVNNGTVMTPLTGNAVVAGSSRFIVTAPGVFGMQYEGQNINYLSGVATGGSVTTLVDANAFWSTATGSGGSAGATTFTISAPGSPIHNGWFVSGTGIQTGSRVVSGGGTTTITVDVPLTGTVSGAITFTAWNAQTLVGRQLRIISSSTGSNQQLAISAVTPNTGTITMATGTAPVANVSSYAILPTIVPGVGTWLSYQSNSALPSLRGRYLFRPRGGAAAGFDKFDLTTDEFQPLYVVPATETLGQSTMWAYDGKDRIYWTKDLTQRLYYLDLSTNTISGAGIYPYIAPVTTGNGSKMEIFFTQDGLQYLWINRQQAVECFRQLLFY
jgi:hypothetical protein